MPFDYTISPEKGVAMVRATGPVDVRSSVEAMGKLASDPSFSREYRVVVDLREMEYRPSLGELRLIAWAMGHEKKSYPNKVAVVLSETQRLERAKRFARFSKLAGFGLELFADMNEAMRWLEGGSVAEAC